MPYVKKDGTRDHAKEARLETPARKAARRRRVANRYKLEKEGKVSKHDGKHVDHVKSIKKGGSDAKSNLKVVSAKKNMAKEGRAKKARAKKK